MTKLKSLSNTFGIELDATAFDKEGFRYSASTTLHVDTDTDPVLTVRGQCMRCLGYDLKPQTFQGRTELDLYTLIDEMQLDSCPVCAWLASQDREPRVVLAEQRGVVFDNLRKLFRDATNLFPTLVVKPFHGRGMSKLTIDHPRNVAELGQLGDLFFCELQDFGSLVALRNQLRELIAENHGYIDPYSSSRADEISRARIVESKGGLLGLHVNLVVRPEGEITRIQRGLVDRALEPV
jgi:hypothetical protein